MATITVRNLPEPVHRALRVRAAEHGRSMEAEVRAILETEVVRSEPDTEQPLRRMRAWVDANYGTDRPRDGVDRFIAERRETWGGE
jgi:plasmid stability protein